MNTNFNREMGLRAARKRVVIEGVTPEVDAGRFSIKRAAGESVVVEADVFADGHDSVASAVLYRNEREKGWSEALMQPLGNDRWRASFGVERAGWYFYTVEGWIAEVSHVAKRSGKAHSG